MCVCVYVCVYECMCVCVCVCMCTGVVVCVRMYIKDVTNLEKKKSIGKKKAKLVF